MPRPSIPAILKTPGAIAVAIVVVLLGVVVAAPLVGKSHPAADAADVTPTATGSVTDPQPVTGSPAPVEITLRQGERVVARVNDETRPRSFTVPPTGPASLRAGYTCAVGTPTTVQLDFTVTTADGTQIFRDRKYCTGETQTFSVPVDAGHGRGPLTLAVEPPDGARYSVIMVAGAAAG